MSDITVSTQRATLRIVVAGVLVLLLAGVLVAGAGAAETDNQLDTGVLENGVTADGDSFNTTAYVGSEDGVVHAVDVGGAEVETLWEFDTEDDLIQSSPTVVDGTVFIGSGGFTDDGTVSGSVYALDAETGDVEWELTDVFRAQASVTVVGGTAYIAGDFDRVWAVDADTGDIEWQEELNTSIRNDGAPHVVNGTVYLSGFEVNFDGTGDGGLYALDAETGEQEWHYEDVNGLRGSPTWDNGTIYVADRWSEGGVHAVDEETGEREWFFDSATSTPGSPLVVDDTVYLPSEWATGGLYAIDADTGDEEWYFDDLVGDSYGDASATYHDGTIYFGTIGNNIDEYGGGKANSSVYAVDADTGDREWAFKPSETVTGNLSVSSTPTVHDGVLYVGAGTSEPKYDPPQDGVLFGLDVDTGDVLFEYENPEPLSGFATSPTVVEAADGNSADSRVAQGVLGHTDAFPNYEISGQVVDPTGEPIEGVTIETQGTAQSATTDEDGYYALSVPSGEHTLAVGADGYTDTSLMAEVDETDTTHDLELAPTYQVGDVGHSNEVSIVDAALIQQQLAGLEPEPFDSTLADVDRSGDVDIVDAVFIQQSLANMRAPGETAITDPTAEATGDTVEVTATVENVGGMGTLQTVEHQFAGDDDALDEHTRAVEAVDLAPGAETELTFTVDTSALDSGTHYYEISTDDDSALVTVEIGDD